MAAPKDRILVWLLTYGEPAEPGWRDQYRYSLNILRRLTRLVAPIPRPTMPFIAAYRGWLRVRLWREEDYHSPLDRITRQQAESLALALQSRDPERAYEVRPVFEFSPPLLQSELERIQQSPPDRVLILPMYLVDCDFTSGISQKLLKSCLPRFRPGFPAPEYVSRWSEDDRLVELMARFVVEQTHENGWSEADCAASGLLLGVHGTLVKGPPGIDTGLTATESFYERLAARLKPCFAAASIGWLNHRMGGEWTSPDLDTAARTMVASGIQRAVYYPFGFLADNAETQLEGRKTLRQQPLNVLHLPCLNVWPPFVDHLAESILTAEKSKRAQ